MRRAPTLEERIAGFTIEFIKAVARINENLVYPEYCMFIGEKRIKFSWIPGTKMTAADCLKEADKFQEKNAVTLSGKGECVAYMVCDGDLYDKLYGYSAYQEDIYGDGDEAERLWHKLYYISMKYNLSFDFSGRGSLIFYDDAYTKIHSLLNYEFYDGGRMDSPIVILGPDGSATSMLRAYAYGGLIGRIGTIGMYSSHLAYSKSYSKYLGETYFSEDDEIDRKYLEYMEEYVNRRAEEYKGDSLCQKLSCRLRELLNDPMDQMLTEPEYLDLILKAAQKWSMNNKGMALGERRIQTAIVKQHMKKAPEDGWCVIDMEYTVKTNLSRSGNPFSPDMVVFDQNNGFGFMELKYADKNTENLDKHYTDTRNVIQNSEAVKTIAEELKRRSTYLWEYGLISDAIYQAMKASDVPKLWQGFLFVGGKRENAARFAEGLAAKCKDIKTDGDCRFAFFPYEEENSADSINKIRLDFHSMQDYEHFIAGEKIE